MNIHYIVNQYQEEINKYAHSDEEESMTGIQGGKVSDAFNIRSIQSWISQFPWEYLDKPRPNITMNGVMDDNTKQALSTLETVGTELKSQILLSALAKINNGDLQDGSSELFSAMNEVKKNIKDDEEYLKEKKQEKWDYSKKIEYLNTTKWPSYFPKPWQAQNVGKYVGGGPNKEGKACGPWLPYSEFRSCMTPYYNAFLSWGPQSPLSGANAVDPRLMRIKSLYPEAFSYEKIRERMNTHEWFPVAPSAGIAPFIDMPKSGDLYYANPHDPRPNIEGVRFYDEEDYKDYWKYRELFDEFKKQEMENPETTNYLIKFFEHYPYKQKPAPYKSPNEWSKKYYQG